jgi:hypothetical protein
LQVLLDGSAPADFPDDLRQRIEAAVLPGLRPVSPLPGVFPVTVTLLISAIVVVVIANWRLGTAGWHARDSLQIFVDFSLLGIALAGLANVLARQMMPGARLHVSTWFYLGAPLLGLFAAAISLFGYRWTPQFLPLALSCWEIGVVCAAISAPLFWLTLRRGFSLDPITHGATAGLLGGLVGVTVLEVYCPYLDRLHISTGHIGAAVTSALAGAAWGGFHHRIRRRGLDHSRP